MAADASVSGVSGAVFASTGTHWVLGDAIFGGVRLLTQLGRQPLNGVTPAHARGVGTNECGSPLANGFPDDWTHLTSKARVCDGSPDRIAGFGSGHRCGGIARDCRS